MHRRSSSSEGSDMAESPTSPGCSGASRARILLYGIPESFNEFTHMDQCTFVALADWILANCESSTANENISVEESLFVFLDIVAQGNSFKNAAYTWSHDINLTQAIFLNIVNALTLLREKEGISTSCPPLNSSANKTRWRVLHTWRPGKSRPDGMMKVGDEYGGGLSVSQERLIEAMKALNNFIHECKELID